MKILTIGESNYDICTFLNEFPKANTNEFISDETLESGDGIGANIACMLAKWGEEVYLSTALGSDNYGEKLRKEYEMSSIKNDYIEMIFDKETPRMFSIFDKKTSKKTNIKIINK